MLRALSDFVYAIFFIHDRCTPYLKTTQVCELANLLKKYGIKKGDTVTVYMPMIPEAAMCMLACARVGAIHSVVFAGFSATALKDRILDARSKLVLTADQGVRGGKIIELKKIVDESITLLNADADAQDWKARANGGTGKMVESVFVFKRTKADVNFVKGRDVWADDELPKMKPYCPPEMMDAEDLLFMLYTSGSTGKPKGETHTETDEELLLLVLIV